jgi:hypothetical protein
MTGYYNKRIIDESLSGLTGADTARRPADEAPGNYRYRLLPDLPRGGILKGAMETRIRSGAMAGFDCLIRVKRPGWRRIRSVPGL